MDLLCPRRVDPVHQSPRTRMYGYFTHGTVPPSRPYSSGFLSLPNRLRRLPSPIHLAMDTLPSEELTSFFGQRGITPAFGYGPPHPSARKTSTFLNNALLSTQYASGLTRIGLGMTFTRCSEVKFSAKENGTK